MGQSTPDLWSRPNRAAFSIRAPAAAQAKEQTLARKKSKPVESGYALFDVLYEDGSRSSNRRVPRSILGGLDGDEPARKIIEEQDNAIAEKAGRPRIPIKKITRSPK
jgi:hypothetical protein